ncbi:MAG: hypothetical protein RR412_09630 [Burkholderiaceae bacterium]
MVYPKALLLAVFSAALLAGCGARVATVAPVASMTAAEIEAKAKLPSLADDPNNLWLPIFAS